MHVGVLLDLADPVADALERPPVRDVVDEQDALRAAEVGGRDGAEALLAGGVPDLELDAFAVHFHVFDLEVDADGRDERGREAVVGVAEQQARFTHAAVADH
mmetsp:Transcript_9632/g.20473  ORF Transcript_9632/g.20473 Transcript_9632/m.20473 type:complete len:102 (-) Transcript_9632:330-635(-)